MRLMQIHQLNHMNNMNYMNQINKINQLQMNNINRFNKINQLENDKIMINKINQPNQPNQYVSIYGFDSIQKKYIYILRFKNCPTSIYFPKNVIDKIKKFSHIQIRSHSITEKSLLTVPYFKKNIKFKRIENLDEISKYNYIYPYNYDILYYYNQYENKHNQLWIIKSFIFEELTKNKNNPYFCLCNGFDFGLCIVYNKKNNLTIKRSDLYPSALSSFNGNIKNTIINYHYKLSL